MLKNKCIYKFVYTKCYTYICSKYNIYIMINFIIGLIVFTQILKINEIKAKDGK